MLARTTLESGGMDDEAEFADHIEMQEFAERNGLSRGCVQLQSSRVVRSRPGLARNARRMPRTTKPGKSRRLRA
jgi:hypothetical protein